MKLKPYLSPEEDVHFSEFIDYLANKRINAHILFNQAYFENTEFTNPSVSLFKTFKSLDKENSSQAASKQQGTSSKKSSSKFDKKNSIEVSWSETLAAISDGFLKSANPQYRTQRTFSKGNASSHHQAKL